MIDSKTKNTHNAFGRLKIVSVVVLAAVIIYLCIALYSFSMNDSGWSSVSSEQSIRNYAGPVGAYISSFILSIFGAVGFLIPFALIDTIRVIILKNKDSKTSYSMVIVRIIGVILLALSACGLSQIYLGFANYWLPQNSGGILGYIVSNEYIKYLGSIGGTFALAVSFFIGLTLYCGTAWIHLIKALATYTATAITLIFKARPKKDISDKLDSFDDFNSNTTNTLNKPAPKITSAEIEPTGEVESDLFDEVTTNSHTDEHELTFVDKKKMKPLFEKKAETKTHIKESNIIKTDANPPKNKIDGLPSLDLLIEPDVKKQTVTQQELTDTSSLLEQTLNDFNINAKVVGAYPGPVITRYEIELARGTKVSKLVGISQDLARALSTASVRVVEVIPGKPYVGLELPNTVRQMVRIKEVLSSNEFISSKAATIMGIGVDISGKPTFAELAKMPHLLVAGTTGSGKSVGVNAMIVSMLYKCTPDELKFIMIDPKMLELSIYDGIPHLLTPVVTDMTQAANSLRWCVKEMERRYALMSAAGVRNIALLNDKIEQAEKDGRPLKDTMFIKMNPERAHEAPTLTKMPYIVVVADEFADMIMVVGKKVEELIARLAQKARAAGIHIILATQRPSADVVTGLIKANIPTRMAFQVSAKIDSRIMLDQQGAEQLLGNGDMLYLKPGLGAPMRIHGAFVEDDEVHRIVEKWKEYGVPEYIESILDESEDGSDSNSNTASDGASEDPLYNDAVEIVLKSQKASISAVQRRLKIGYNRSARLMEEMEENGIVSEMGQNGMREVLIKRET